MSALHIVGQVDFDVAPVGYGYLAVASAACLKLDDGYLSRAFTLTDYEPGLDEREAIASASAHAPLRPRLGAAAQGGGVQPA